MTGLRQISKKLSAQDGDLPTEQVRKQAVQIQSAYSALKKAMERYQKAQTHLGNAYASLCPSLAEYKTALAVETDVGGLDASIGDVMSSISQVAGLSSQVLQQQSRSSVAELQDTLEMGCAESQALTEFSSHEKSAMVSLEVQRSEVEAKRQKHSKLASKNPKKASSYFKSLKQSEAKLNYQYRVLDDIRQSFNPEVQSYHDSRRSELSHKLMEFVQGQQNYNQRLCSKWENARSLTENIHE
eukprot:gb/GECH01001863.1/.p1 GENE.gb/GECH01001863.1/~~gb/GECH01001863.1/.p1  ORF type:complete len:242 (+),score=50.34 gb/GECH01001863.1/:1-726(+)